MLTASTPGAPLLARTFSHASIHEAFGDLKRLHLRLGSHPRLLPRRVGLGLTLVCPAPSLRPHYRALTATTSRSAPVPRIGTLPLTVATAWGPPSRRPVAPSPPSPAGQYRDDRFSCSMPAPTTSSRHLYTGHRQDSTQAASWLRARHQGAPSSRGHLTTPVSMPSFYSFDASAVVHTRSSSRRTPDPLTAGLFPQRSPPRLLTDAACGGLRAPPARRTRRANLHHWHSTVRAGDLLHRHHSTFRTHVGFQNSADVSICGFMPVSGIRNGRSGVWRSKL